MDKEYLIHNIDYKDNPEDQHLTVDITLSNLDVSGQDIIADVGIDTYVNGMPTRSNKYEDVSLTGAGGGDFTTCTATITDEDGITYQMPRLFNFNGLEYIIGNDNNVSGEFDVVLYKGNAVFFLVNDEANTVTISGDITVLEENIAYLVTGDFSVTLER